MKKVQLSTLVGWVCLALILAAMPMTASAKPTELRLVTFNTKLDTLFWYYQKYIDTVKERSKGELVIKHVGGPEVVKIWDLGKSVQAGVADLGIVYTSAYKGIVREAPALAYSLVEPAVERKVGAWDILREQHEKAGLYFVGRVGYSPPNAMVFLYLMKPIKSPKELAGKKIGTFGSPTWVRKGLRASAVRVSKDEIYTSLERGLMDGVVGGLGTHYDIGAHKLTKWIVDHAINRDNATLFMNLAKWKSLPKDQQDLLKQVAIDLEPAWKRYYKTQTPKDRKRMTDAGASFFKFSKADEKWWYDTWFDLMWGRVVAKSPKLAPKLRNLLTP